METEKKFNVYNFLNEIKQEIEQEVKEQGLKTICEIEKLIYYEVENYLVYYDYTRDVEIVAYLEDRVSPEIETNIKYEGNISAILNKLAMAYLIEYLNTELDLNNLE